MEDFRRKLTREPNEPEMFNSISFECGIVLSIQASRTHYCHPRETHESAYHYTEFEMAIFDEEDWVNPTEDERFESIIDDSVNWEDGTCSVGGHITVEKVQQICDLVEGFGTNG